MLRVGALDRATPLVRSEEIAGVATKASLQVIPEVGHAILCEQMTPRKSAELFERVGSMTPSKSSLGRLPKVLAERWEDNREAFEAALRDGLQIPEGAVSIAVSLDGVLAPIDGANNPTDVRAKACRTHARTEVSVSSRSRATSPAVLSPAATSRTSSALYSGVNDRRFLFVPMIHLYQPISGPRLVSTEPGQDQIPISEREPAVRESRRRLGRSQRVPTSFV